MTRCGLSEAAKDAPQLPTSEMLSLESVSRRGNASADRRSLVKQAMYGTLAGTVSTTQFAADSVPLVAPVTTPLKDSPDVDSTEHFLTLESSIVTYKFAQPAFFAFASHPYVLADANRFCWQ